MRSFIVKVTLCASLALIPFVAGAQVARIGSQEYTTLADAVSAATSGQTITLMEDVTLDKALTIGASASKHARQFTIDFDGKTINGKANTTVFTVYDDVTFKGPGQVNGVSKGMMSYIMNVQGNVVLEGVNITDAGKQGGYFISVANGAKLTLESGILTTDYSRAAVVKVSAGGQFEMNGGKLVNNYDKYNELAACVSTSVATSTAAAGVATINAGELVGTTIGAWSDGIINFTGGKVTAPYDVWVNKGTVNISGGEFYANPTAVYLYTATSVANITGGEFWATGEEKRYLINKYDSVSEAAKANISGGIFHEFDPMNNAAEGAETDFTDDNYCSLGADGVYTVGECTHKVAVGAVHYDTFVDAIKAINADAEMTSATVKMLADDDMLEAISILAGKNVTLDLNGKTVKNEASKSLTQLITVNGKLTIDDSSADKNGKIQNTASAKYVIKTGIAAAVLTLNNGTIETTTGNGNGAVYGTNGAFVMTGGKIIAAGTGVTSKNVNISGGQITATAGQALCAAGTITGGTFTSANNNAVYANQSGTLEITGGNFTGVSTKPTINIYTTDVKVTGATLNNGVGFASNATAMVLPGSDDAYLASTHAAFYDGETLVGYAPINTGLFASLKVSGKTVKLTKDVATTTYLNVTKSFTLDLNNHNITCTPAKADAAFLTKGTASAPVELTIKGEGKVSCGDHGEGCNAIQVGNCTTLNIEGGEFEVPGDNSTIYIVTTANTEAAKSIVNISGGEFKSGDGKYVLNIKDDVRAYNTFNVTGGTFVGFNPANNIAEGAGTNFTAEGYCVTNVDNEYTVVECNHVAVIGDKHYETLAAAVAAVPADGTATTITMLADVELTATVATTYGQNVILDLNGKNITSTVLAIKNLGDLEVTGTGNITVNGTKNTLYGINNAGAAGKKANLTIGENVTVTAPCVAVNTGYGKTTVNGSLANTQADASNIYSTLRISETSSEVIVAESAKVTGVVNAVYGAKGTLEVNSTNVGKIYADGSATQGLKIKKTAAIEELDVVGLAEFSDVEDYYVAAKAISACTGTVKLVSDVNGALALSAGKTVTLDLNGHKVSAETYPIKVEGNLTITGEGTVQSTGMGQTSGTNSSFIADQGSSVQAATYVLKNGKLTILSGNYVAGYEGAEGNPAVYVRDNAVVEIKGGYFVGGSKYLLNKLDASRETSTIEVTGGTFRSFNPADNIAEGEHTNFVAEGYLSYTRKIDGVTCYEVKVVESMISVTSKTDEKSYYSVMAGTVELQDAGVKKVDILPGEEPNTIKTCDVTFERTFGTTNFQAWCAPFEISYADIPEGVHFGKVISMRMNAGNQLEGMGYHLVDGGEYPTVEANTPYIVYVDEPGTYTFSGSNVKRPYTLVVGKENDYVDYGNYRFQFFYNYESTVMKDQNALFISAGALSYTKNSALTLAPYRFYISIYRKVRAGEQGDYYTSYNVVEPETFFQSNSVANSTRMFLYDVENPGMTTGIDIPMHHHDEPTSAGSRQTGSYDLSGRTVTKTTKGLYIENGKKIIVK